MLFASTKTKPIDTTPFRHLFPFDSKYVRIDGFRCHYVDEGAGDPLVMVHGNPTWSFYFRELIQAFSPWFRTIALDHIGCGLSDKPPVYRYNYTLQRRVDDLNFFVKEVLEPGQKINLVVHDWGGMIGVAYALQHLERIRRLVVFNTAAFFPPAGKTIPLRLRLIRDFGFVSEAAVLGLNLFARAALTMASQRNLPPDVKKGLIAPYNCPANRIATLMFVRDIPVKKNDSSYALVRWVDDNLFRLEGIPMLLCWGMRDFVFDVDYLNEWQRRFPAAGVQRFEAAGHYLLEDAPRKVIDCVRDFMVS